MLSTGAVSKILKYLGVAALNVELLWTRSDFSFTCSLVTLLLLKRLSGPALVGILWKVAFVLVVSNSVGIRKALVIHISLNALPINLANLL